MAGKRILVSGEVAEGRTTSTLTYVVFDTKKKTVVGSMMLPNAGQFPRFRLLVDLTSDAESLDVGTLDAAGKFTSAGFTIEDPETSRGAVGAAAA